MKKYRLLNIIYGIVLFFFIISLSISIPILCRFIHTICIEPMHMVESLNNQSGLNYTFDDVVEAYNQVLDYCVFYKEFGAGKLIYPEKDVLHFQDCRVLFTIDFVVLLVTFVLIIVLHIVQKIKRVVIFKPTTYLVAGIFTIVLPCVLVGICSIDFNEAFMTFHRIFFPGKDNFMFRSWENYIILIMPEEFFMVCAIVIASGFFIGATVLIIIGLLKRRKIVKRKKSLDIYENY